MHDKLTKEDLQRIQEEIDYRTLVVRREALEDVKTARAHGDLSENFEYKAAKQFKNQNESRIRYLTKMRDTAILIEDETAADEAGINNRVTICYEEEDEEETVTLVTTVRGNSRQGLITTESPLGRALLGHKAGETVQVRVNEQVSYPVRIVSIDGTVDEADIAIRKY